MGLYEIELSGYRIIVLSRGSQHKIWDFQSFLLLETRGFTLLQFWSISANSLPQHWGFRFWKKEDSRKQKSTFLLDLKSTFCLDLKSTYCLDLNLHLACRHMTSWGAEWRPKKGDRLVACLSSWFTTNEKTEVGQKKSNKKKETRKLKNKETEDGHLPRCRATATRPEKEPVSSIQT